MKITIFSLIFLMVSACSPKPDSGQSQIKPLSSQGSGAFGVVEYGKTEYRNFIFTNDEVSSLSLIPEILGPNAQDFSVGLTLGCSNIEVAKSCLVKVFFNSVNKLAGNYEATLKLGSQEVNLSASINSVPSPNIEIYFDNQKIEENKDLGIVTSKEIRLFNLKVKNNSPVIAPLSTLSVNNSHLSLAVNQCTNVSLKPGQVCYVKGFIKGTSVNEIKNTSISFLDKNVIVSMENQAILTAGNLQSVQTSVELGDFSGTGEQLIKAIILENQGNGVAQLDDIQVPSDYTVLYNNCFSVKPGNKCIIRLSFINNPSSKGQRVDEVLINDTSLDIYVNQVNRMEELSSVTVQMNPESIVNQCISVSISFFDNLNVGFIISSPLIFNSNFSLYEDSSCLNEATKEIPAFSYQRNFYFKSPATAGSQVLQITKNTVAGTAPVQVYEVLTASASNYELMTTNSRPISISGGKLPYSISSSQPSSISGQVFTAQSEGTATVTISDQLGQSVALNFNIAPLLSLSSGTCTSDTPESVACQLSFSGGVGQKTFSTTAGSVNSSGSFVGQCINNLGQSTITVTDEQSNSQQINLTYPCVYRSCNQILADNYGLSPGSYWVDPDGINTGSYTPVKVYCDQSADQGGWTLVLRGKNNDGINFSSAATGTLTAPNQSSTAKYSDSLIEALRSGGRYRMQCSSYKRFLDPQVFNLNVPRTSAEMRTYADINFTSNPTPSTPQSNVNNIKFGDRANSGIGGWYLQIDGGYMCNNGTAHSDIGLGRLDLELYVKTPYNKIPSSCLDAKNQGVLNQAGSLTSGYWTIDPDGFGVGVAPFTVYCDQETNGGGWTLYARFDGDDQPAQHYGSADFGTISNLTGQYSLQTSKLGSISKIMAKTGASNISWNFQTAQVINIPTSGGFTVELAGAGYDGCTPQRLSYNTTGCWAGRIAGPTVGVTNNEVNGCANTGNWQQGDYFYGRADQGGACIPRGKWFDRPSDPVFMPIQEWYVK